MGKNLKRGFHQMHGLWRKCLFLMLVMAFPAFGQNVLNAQTVASGTVVDESGEPIVGCMVFVKGTTSQGTMTDMDGKFTLEVPSNSVLTFSMMGMTEVDLPPANGMNVVLKSAMTELDDVIVVGYGTQKRASLTGAISSIDNDEILTTKSQSLAASLAGKIPGLRIRQTDGMPGAFGVDINMRGMGRPMLVIDGVVRDEPTEFQKLNPDDIESITVLKDASAAIYGMNSSNGALIVTTKSGKSGPLKVSLSANLGLSTPTAYTDMFNVSQYYEILNEGTYYSTGIPRFSSADELRSYQNLPYTDWYDAVFKKSAFQQTYNVSVEGGNDKISTYTNIGYTSDNGLLRSGDISYNKYSLRNNTKYKINDYLRLDLNLYGYVDYREQPGTWDDAFFFLNKATHGLIPSEPVYANNNKNYFNRPAPLNDNPVQFSQREQFGYREWRDKFFQGSLALTFDIPKVPGLYLKAAAFYDMKSFVQTRVQKCAVNYNYSADSDTYTPTNNYDPSIQEESTLLQRFNFQGSINYKNTFKDAHNVSATAVFETRQEDTRYVSAKRYYEDDFYTTDNIDRAPEAGQETRGNTELKTFVSVIGRFDYDYKGRYLVGFAFREDGSYRYSPDSRWGFFPVVSAGWRISEEPFIKNNTDIVSNLKIRASWGRSGEDAGSAFQYILGYKTEGSYVFDGQLTNAYVSSGLINRYLTWVTTETTNIGIDLSLWNGMLDFSGDIYRRDKEGILARRSSSLPNTFGATLPEENLNSERLQGMEIVLSHKNTVGDFSYGISFNMNFSRVMQTYEERGAFRSSWDRWKNGKTGRYKDIGWGYTVLGQYQNFDQIRNGVIETSGQANEYLLPGDYIYEDVNGDGIITDEDQLPIFWTGYPKITYGLTFYASLKGIDFNMLWSGAGLYTAKYSEILGQVLQSGNCNSPAMYYDRWHQEDIYDPNSEWIPGEYPATRLSNNDNTANKLESKMNRVNASYIRLTNVELGYTFPKRMLSRAKISNLRVYVNLTNPLVICNKYLRSFDPEISDGNGFKYPLQKSYNFGVNISF